jgi:hypothetical protein
MVYENDIEKLQLNDKKLFEFGKKKKENKK